MKKEKDTTLNPVPDRVDRTMALEQIRLLLRNRPRDLLFFEIAIQTQATIPEILSLRVVDLKRLKEGETLPLPPTPVAPIGPARFNTRVKRAFLDFTAEEKRPEDSSLFISRKGRRALSHTSASRMLSNWLQKTGLGAVGGLRGLRAVHFGETAGETERSVSPTAIRFKGVLPQVAPLTLQEAVYRALEKAIISGRIPPGQKLVTEEIARQMSVSRIPVREAMGRLEARGFIVTRAKWGSVVKELSRENFKEILDLRLLLECEAVAKAAPQAKDETIAALGEVHREFSVARTCNDAERLLKANREFHLMAYKDADSPILIELINQVWNRVSPYYHIMFRQSVTAHPQAGMHCHEQMLKAIQRRDAEQARHWLKTDLIGSAEYVLKLFDLYQTDG